MRWLKSFLAWLGSLFVHEIVEQVKEEAKKPDTITDEKIPDSISDGLQRDIADKLRALGGSGKQE